MSFFKKIKNKIRPAINPLWESSVGFKIRGIVFKLHEIVTGYRITKKHFIRRVGYIPNLKDPKSLNEKMLWKKIHDRNPLLPFTSDKYKVRDYVKETLGKEGDDILVPLLYVTDNSETIPFDNLPDEYIIKANHNSGGYFVVEKGQPIDRKEIVSIFDKYLKTPYGIFKHEWAYQPISRKIIIEKLLREEDGDLAQDYKFHVFHGVCQFIHTTPKVGGKRTGTRSLFTSNWKLIPVGWKHPKGQYIEPPQKFEDMKRIAEKLAAPFDYVRVDLYNVSDKIYFGELTHYHGSGMEKFDPESFDFEAGKWWEITPNYWLKNRHGAE